MADVYAEIAKMDTGDIPVELVTISIDPEDTPDVLLSMSEEVGADSDTWHFLTGSEARGALGYWWRF